MELTKTNQKQTFLSEHFLLYSDAAQYLYHEHAAHLPIIDYHNHLPPNEIAANKQFANLTSIWLNGDHYKWRAMRANGISEKFISGDAPDADKFQKWAETVPYTMRNPLFHWTQLELKRYFGINKILSPKTASFIYEATREQLQTEEFSTRNLLRKMKVEVLCTTDDPTDDLKSHLQLGEADFEIGVFPTFRPDPFLLIHKDSFQDKIHRLEEASDKVINSFETLLEALEKRIHFFHEAGCRLADHGLEKISAADFNDQTVDKILKKKLHGESISWEEAEEYQSALLHHLALLYHAKKWTMQFHLGAIRNNNDRLLANIGADAGCDSIGDYSQAVPLSKFLNRLDKKDQLAKTILYNLNPADNEVFASMAGNFNDGSIIGKVQWGSAWWFLDQKDGMEKQINTLSNLGLLSRFIGMLTDSRSFLSFPRHEYFRRILCNLIGRDVENGELPNDLEWLGSMVENICYYNAKNYFDFQTKENA